jgi:hypothetical protein
MDENSQTEVNRSTPAPTTPSSLAAIILFVITLLAIGLTALLY